MDRRSNRQRMYSITALLLGVVVAIVAMSALLQVGTKRIDEKVYAFPWKTLKALSEAENRYRRHDLDKDGKHYYAKSLDELHAAGCITKKLAVGAIKDYSYAVIYADTDKEYALTATPSEVTTESLFYFVDQTHVIRANEGAPADARSKIFWHPFRGIQWSGKYR